MTPPSFPTHAEPRVFAAHLGALPDTAAFVQDFCERHAIPSAVRLRLTLIVEELLTNTVTHGHQGDSDAPVRIALWLENGAVLLFHEDSAPRFDPLPRLRAGSLRPEALLPPRAPGGLGLHLIGQLVTSARYAYEDGLNRLWLVVPLT